jgi:hypothetical protein
MDVEAFLIYRELKTVNGDSVSILRKRSTIKGSFQSFLKSLLVFSVYQQLKIHPDNLKI